MKPLHFIIGFLLSFASVPVQAQKIREGKHGITLQWIGWDKPGTVTIKKTGTGVYSVKGSQKDKTTGDYVTIEGTLTVGANTRELTFNGTLELLVNHNNNGQVCKKEGPLVFKATGKRKYWRCQDMLNCDGVVTDYVDIYF
jgi:hypothetical protein